MLEDELDFVLELEDLVLDELGGDTPEELELLSPGSVDDDPCIGSSEEKSDILPGNSEPETDAPPASMIFTFFSVSPPEQPESTQIAAAIETAPVNLFFIIHFPIFLNFLSIYNRTL